MVANALDELGVVKRLSLIPQFEHRQTPHQGSIERPICPFREIVQVAYLRALTGRPDFLGQDFLKGKAGDEGR